MCSRYSKDFSRYTHGVTSSLLFDTPLRNVLYTQYQTKRGSPLSQVYYLWSKATARRIWTKYSHNFFSNGTTFIHVPSFHYSKFDKSFECLDQSSLGYLVVHPQKDKILSYPLLFTVQQSRNMPKIFKSYILTPPHPQGHVMSVTCEEPIDELTVQVWFTMLSPKL